MRSWILAAMLLAVPVAVAEADMRDCYEATCRITLPGGAGGATGCAFHVDAEKLYILTNAHVVDEATTVEVEFWQQGHPSTPLTAVVEFRHMTDTMDIAIIAVPRRAFGRYLPRVIPFAGPKWQYTQGGEIISVGCARGAWPTGWRGHILGRWRGRGHMMFKPCPALGRSGSAIFDPDGTRIIALLYGKDPEPPQGENAHGYAIPIADIAKLVGYEPQGTQWGPSQGPSCGPDGCPPQAQQSPPKSRQFQFFGRQEQQQQLPLPPMAEPYPMLPGPRVSVTTPPPVDEVAREKADAAAALAGRIEDRVAAVETVVASVQAAVASVEESIDALSGSVEETGETVVEAAEEQKEENTRLSARLAAVLQEKADSMGGAAGKAAQLGAGTLTAISGIPVVVLGVFGLIIFILIKKDIRDYKESGGEDKLAIQKILGGLSEATPWSFDDKIATRVNDRIDAVMSKRMAPQPAQVVVAAPPAAQVVPAQPAAQIVAAQPMAVAA